jgi:hypothetical protein
LKINSSTAFDLAFFVYVEVAGTLLDVSRLFGMWRLGEALLPGAFWFGAGNGQRRGSPIATGIPS